MNIPSDFKPKKFWEKPEGTAGMALLAAVGVAAGVASLYLMDKILPMIARIFSSLVSITISGVVLCIIGYLIIDPHWRALWAALGASASRKLAGIFVAVDPIGIMREHITKAKKYLRNVCEKIEIIRGMIEGIKRDLDTNNKKITQNIQLVEVAKKDPQRYASKAKLATNDIGRFQKTGVTLKDLLTKLELIYRNLCRIQEASDFLIKDTESEIEVRIKEYKTIKAAHSAMKSAMQIIKPEDDELYMYNLASEYMADDVARKVGDIERALEVSQDFLDGVDLKNMQFQQDGWDVIDKWEKEESPLLGTEKQKLNAAAKDDNDVLDLDHPNPVKDPSEYVPAKERFKQYL